MDSAYSRIVETPIRPVSLFLLAPDCVDTALCLEKTRFLEEQQKEQKKMNFSLKHKADNRSL